MSESHAICTQEDNISHIQRTLDRMEETQRDLVDVMKEVASHTARVDSLEVRSTQHFNDLDDLFKRVRHLEITNGKIDMLFNIVANKYFVALIIGLLGLTIIGAVLDIIYHYDTLKRLTSLIF